MHSAELPASSVAVQVTFTDSNIGAVTGRVDSNVLTRPELSDTSGMLDSPIIPYSKRVRKMAGSQARNSGGSVSTGRCNNSSVTTIPLSRQNVFKAGTSLQAIY